jgi:predicted glutamine amidotransferase
MCGILGYIGQPMTADKMAVLFMYNNARGGHATGYYSDTDGVVKQSVDVRKFLSKHKMSDDAKLFIGHTRYGTVGKNTKENAHPFTKGLITGVHNGCLSNERELSKSYDFDYEVDSEAIFEMIRIKKEQGLSEVIGSIAIAYTKSDNKLYLYRRDNPIYYGYANDGKTLVFSSMDDSLMAIGINDIKSLPTDTVFCIDNNAELTEMTTIEKPTYYGTIKQWDDHKGSGHTYYGGTQSSGTKYGTLIDQYGSMKTRNYSQNYNTSTGTRMCSVLDNSNPKPEIKQEKKTRRKRERQLNELLCDLHFYLDRDVSELYKMPYDEHNKMRKEFTEEVGDFIFKKHSAVLKHENKR